MIYRQIETIVANDPAMISDVLADKDEWRIIQTRSPLSDVLMLAFVLIGGITWTSGTPSLLR